MKTWPLWACAAAIWVGTLRPAPWWCALVGVAVIAAAAVIAPPRRLAVVLAGLALVGCGLAGARVASPGGPLDTLADLGGTAQMRGMVVTEPQQTPFGFWMLVRVSAVAGERLGQRVLLRVGADPPAFGERLAFQGSARPLDTDNDFERHLRRQGVRVEVSPTTPLQRTAPAALIAVTNAIRVRVRVAAANRLPDDAAGLLTGLVTGDTLLLSSSADETLTAAGLSHLVAVSGANVALVIAGALGLGAALRLGARGRRRMATAAVLAFVVLVRAEPSVLRAAAMALLVLGAQAWGRGVDARHALAAAVMVLLLADPLLGAQLGFTLSVLATAGVLVVAPALARRLPGPRAVTALLSATVGAQLAVAPVLLTQQGGVPATSIVANLVAVPAAAVASAVGVAVALLAQLSAGVAGLVAILARPALEVVLWSGRTFADGPQLTLTSLLSPVAVFLVAGVVLRRRTPRVAVATVALAVVVATLPSFRPAHDVSALTVTALDVGQGDAILVEVPSLTGTARMLVDGGPDRVAALHQLRRRGIRRLDVVVASHPHADHTNGLIAVALRLGVGAVVVGPDPLTELDDPAPSAAALLATARTRNIPVVPIAAGQSFPLGQARVDVLSPPADGSLGDEPNDNSLVLRVADASGAALLTGDAEVAAQQRLLRRPELLRADILKVPHHGGNTNAAGFFDAVGATTALIAVGAGNDYGHPHPDVLAELAGITILRTDTAGTVSAQFE